LELHHRLRKQPTRALKRRGFGPGTTPSKQGDQQMTDEEIYDALREARAEINRLNEAAGETVFNPAATSLVDSSLYELWGRINTQE